MGVLMFSIFVFNYSKPLLSRFFGQVQVEIWSSTVASNLREVY